MIYPVVVTAVGSETGRIADNEDQRNEFIREFIGELGYTIEEVICFELGQKWDFAGFMFVNTPFPVQRD